MSLNWRDALKEFNEKRKANNEGSYIIPKRGSPEYVRVRKLMGHEEDAQEIKPNMTVTGKPKRSESKSRTPPKKELALEPILEKNEVSEATNKLKKTRSKPKPKALEEDTEDLSPVSPPEVKSKAKGKKKKELGSTFGDRAADFKVNLKI